MSAWPTWDFEGNKKILEIAWVGARLRDVPVSAEHSRRRRPCTPGWRGRQGSLTRPPPSSMVLGKLPAHPSPPGGPSSLRRGQMPKEAGGPQEKLLRWWALD